MPGNFAKRAIKRDSNTLSNPRELGLSYLDNKGIRNTVSHIHPLALHILMDTLGQAVTVTLQSKHYPRRLVPPVCPAIVSYPNRRKTDNIKTMKLSVVAITALFSVVLANDTIPVSSDAYDSCRRDGGLGQGGCCSYSDCGYCGFYERCCYKGDRDEYSRGSCKCGVNSYKQGTCY